MPPTPIQRLADLLRAARMAHLPAEAHEILLQHAQELEKILTPAPDLGKKESP